MCDLTTHMGKCISDFGCTYNLILWISAGLERLPGSPHLDMVDYREFSLMF